MAYRQNLDYYGMMRSIIIFCMGLILLGLGVDAKAQTTASSPIGEAKNLFIGIDWSVVVSAPAQDRLDKTSVDGIFLTLAGGVRSIFPIFPIRVRLGAGWFPERPFRLVLGMELAILEKLNQSGARAFGVYAFTDMHITPSSLPTFHLAFNPIYKIGLLLPVSPTGGLCLAAGVDGSGRPTASLAIMNGGYVSANGPYGHVR